MSKAKSYYANDFLEKQLSYYRSLPEKQRRHFLAMEYERLGAGSKRYLARVFGAARQTIRKGLRELAENNYEVDYARQRVAGGGRKKRSDNSGTDKLDT
jgi:DeoR/GlpR family transcriptional regulator of sugar metabolism